MGWSNISDTSEQMRLMPDKWISVFIISFKSEFGSLEKPFLRIVIIANGDLLD